MTGNNDSTTDNHESSDVAVVHENKSSTFNSLSQKSLCENIDNEILSQNSHLIKTLLFTAASCYLVELLLFFVKKVLLFGLLEAILINFTTRRQVKKMKIGNRTLRFKSWGHLKIILLCIVNWILVIFTGGLFHACGFSHKMYLSQLDARIYWGNPAKISKKQQQSEKLKNHAIVWEPETDGLGQFVIYSVHTGFFNEWFRLFLMIMNIPCLGLLTPLMHAYFIPLSLKQMKFGGRGRFCIVPTDMIESINKAARINNLKQHDIKFPEERIYESSFPVLGQLPHQPEHSTFELKFAWTATSWDVCKVWFQTTCCMVLTCGCLGCFADNYVRKSYNQFLLTRLWFAKEGRSNSRTWL